ncbi:uncharacterized protein PGTG_14819 [Puccinia graminis f. sp. tritici CRL 75-36-700-3]|uniref:Uncharacterized protein n=1 Tax=Puccinia graminis f. sp. tritici (strain CRL 75-36-700-3 / race SCCL) TaxID=418459 RepID=E3KWD9_PUCGT|nr:uncharacterized protein PGTG_14819 [Puccinia graminis f. sp. tritici CRL 75-36-700-3]EFP88614.2 hypothetical protein PGTG_14819 [Puccinia graminis f. sp. tritici CRL 75-36-700-3]
MPRFNKHTPGPRASNLYPIHSRMNCPVPSSPLERGQVLGSPIQLDSRELSRPPILNASPIVPPSSVRGQASGFPIELDSQGSALSPLADPQTITRPVSPKATQASRADWATSEWCRPASNSRGSLGSPVACCSFEVAELLLNHLLLLLSSNRTVIEEPWTLPQAPRPQNLSTPSNVRSAVHIAPPTLTSASQEESAVSDEDDLESSSSQHTASSNQSYPFVCQHCVASPDPPGFYDVDKFHLLRDHQIDSLLSRSADPARFDRYVPREFTVFYQSAASGFVAYCNAERPLCPRDQAHRVSHFKFLNRSYMSLRRHFCHLE